MKAAFALPALIVAAALAAELPAAAQDVTAGALAALAAASAAPTGAAPAGVGGPPPPGLAAARLLPGWTLPDGRRMVAIELQLEPGWKTYWRAPGDTGIPPSFDWSASGNVAAAEPLWPAPEAIGSGEERVFGYHDRLLLPVALTPAAPGPVDARVAVDFGLCREVCVPARVTLNAAPAGAGPDPQIEAARAAAPARAAEPAACAVTPIADGMRVEASVTADAQGPAPEVAMELAGADRVWVSAPQVRLAGGQVRATADFIPPDGKPFPLDPAAVRLTLLRPGGAIEVEGCRPG